MAFTPINEDYPVGTVQAMNVVDNDLRNLKKGLRERHAVDGNFKADETGDSYIGYHKKVSLIDLATDPTTYTQGGVFYSKSGLLYFINSAGTVIQITTASQLVIGSNSHMISRGFGLTYKDADGVYVEPGTLYHYITQVNTTARTTLVLATGSDWIDGSTASVTSGHIYIYCNSTGSIKLEETAPAYADTAGNTVGKLIYHKEGSAYWRWVGSVTVDSSGDILKYYNIGDMTFYDSYLPTSLLSAGAVTSFADVDCSTLVPTTSLVAKLRVQTGETGSNDNTLFRVNGSTDTVTQVIEQNSVKLVLYFDMPLDSSQIFEYQHNTSGLTVSVGCQGYYNPRN